MCPLCVPSCEFGKCNSISFSFLCTKNPVCVSLSQCVAFPACKPTLLREETAFGVMTVSFLGHLEVKQTRTHLSFPG